MCCLWPVTQTENLYEFRCSNSGRAGAAAASSGNIYIPCLGYFMKRFLWESRFVGATTTWVKQRHKHLTPRRKPTHKQYVSINTLI